jgi:thioredoxin 1
MKGIPMSKLMKVAIVVALAAVVAITIAMKNNKPTTSGTPATAAPPATTAQSVTGLPRLVDLGAKTCIPCKMMAPILEELGTEYAGRLQVEFIDVKEVPEAGKAFGIQLIPTQIFFDASGQERFRHEGFFSKEDILAKWKELGVDLVATALPHAASSSGTSK